MANDKVFVGKTNVVKTKFGEITKVALGPKDFEALQNARNESGWVNLEIKDKRDGGKYIQVQGEYTGPKKSAVNDVDSDLPF